MSWIGSLRKLVMTKSAMNEALLKHTENGHIPGINRMLKSGADVNYQNRNGVTFLMFASGEGKPGVVDFLLKSGANPNLCDKNQITALMVASSSNNLEDVKSILKAGGSINAQHSSDSSSLMLASREGLSTVVQYLLENGADLTLKDRLGKDALDYATQNSHPKTVKVIEDFIQAKETLRSEDSGSELVEVFGIGR